VNLFCGVLTVLKCNLCFLMAHFNYMFVPAMKRYWFDLRCIMLAVHLTIFSGVIAYYPSSIACILFQGMDENFPCDDIKRVSVHVCNNNMNRCLVARKYYILPTLNVSMPCTSPKSIDLSL